MVRAKFYVEEIRRMRTSVPKLDGEKTNWVSGEVQTIILRPVSGGSEENKKFWVASPSGRIELGCANLEAAQLFELGKQYYIDFTEAD